MARASTFLVQFVLTRDRMGVSRDSYITRYTGVISGNQTRRSDMFDSLDETIKHDEEEQISPKEKYLRWLAVAIVSILVFGGLYIGVRLVE